MSNLEKHQQVDLFERFPTLSQQLKLFGNKEGDIRQALASLDLNNDFIRQDVFEDLEMIISQLESGKINSAEFIDNMSVVFLNKKSSNLLPTSPAINKLVTSPDSKRKLNPKIEEDLAKIQKFVNAVCKTVDANMVEIEKRHQYINPFINQFAEELKDLNIEAAFHVNFDRFLEDYRLGENTEADAERFKSMMPFVDHVFNEFPELKTNENLTLAKIINRLSLRLKDIRTLKFCPLNENGEVKDHMMDERFTGIMPEVKDEIEDYAKLCELALKNMNQLDQKEENYASYERESLFLLSETINRLSEKYIALNVSLMSTDSEIINRIQKVISQAIDGYNKTVTKINDMRENNSNLVKINPRQFFDRINRDIANFLCYFGLNEINLDSEISTLRLDTVNSLNQFLLN
ncbi:MAG TPA: hypothetical protein PLQ36_00075 [Candidatus Gracilibacteria bacterium]|nr:hypothetical protein [Candidatus Gracilibacteria bacterium]